MKVWNHGEQERARRLERARAAGLGKVVEAARIGDLLNAILASGDRICTEGNNQKQADVLAQALAKLDPAAINNLHVVQSTLALPAHRDLG